MQKLCEKREIESEDLFPIQLGEKIIAAYQLRGKKWQTKGDGTPNSAQIHHHLSLIQAASNHFMAGDELKIQRFWA